MVVPHRCFGTTCQSHLPGSNSPKEMLSVAEPLAQLFTTETLHILLLKAKAVPLQAWSGPEGSRMLRFPDFMTTAQDGGKVVNLTLRPPLPPGNTPGTHFC